MAWPLVVGALMQFTSSRNTNGHEDQVAMAVGLVVGILFFRSKWLRAHAPFQILAFTRTAFLKGQGSNQFNSNQIYYRNSTEPEKRINSTPPPPPKPKDVKKVQSPLPENQGSIYFCVWKLLSKDLSFLTLQEK